MRFSRQQFDVFHGCCLRSLWLSVFLGLMAQAASANGLSQTEQEIRAAAKTRIEPATALMERLVNINSGTLNHAGVRDVGQILRDEFDQIGFKTQWIDMPKEMNRAGHLQASHHGSSGKKILLLGHLDTVFEKDSPFQQWSRSGNRVKGPGVMDMKGGLVVVLEALRVLHELHAIDDATIEVLFTGDEEKVGDPISVSRGPLVSLAKQSDVVLNFESLITKAGGLDTATTARRGLTSWTLTTTGKQGHSATVFGPKVGYGAVFETARIIDTFRQNLVEQNLTFNPGLIAGGTDVDYDASAAKAVVSGKNNVVASAVRVEGDLRFLSNEQRDRAKEKMRKIVAEHLQGSTAEIQFYDAYPALPPTDGNQSLLNMLSKVSVDAGYGTVEAVEPSARGAADIAFAAPYAAALDGLGVGGKGAHSLDEELDLDSIERTMVRTALMIYRLTKGSGESM